MKEVLVIRNFITSDEAEALNAWVDAGVESGFLGFGVDKNRGNGWSYTQRLTTRNSGNMFENPEIVEAVYQKITDTLGVHDLARSSFGGGKDGVVVSCTLPGGDVYSHVDPMEGGLHCLRCNIMTRGADAGGVLYVNKKKIPINIGDLHCYLPSALHHHVTTVSGTRSRVMWMFGYKSSVLRFEQISPENSEWV